MTQNLRWYAGHFNPFIYLFSSEYTINQSYKPVHYHFSTKMYFSEYNVGGMKVIEVQRM